MDGSECQTSSECRNYLRFLIVDILPVMCVFVLEWKWTFCQFKAVSRPLKIVFY